MILTDANGRPFDKPDPPETNAPIEATIAYLRAMAAYNDAVADCANGAFAEAFRAGKNS